MNFLNALTAALLSLFLLLSNTPQAQPIQQTTSQTTAPTLAKAQNSDTSRNWAGYTADSGTYTGVSGTWTVPLIKDTSQVGADATWVGIGGVTTNDLIQAGTQATVDEQGNVSYGAFYEDLPHPSRPLLNLTVHAGDTMSVSVQKTKDTSWNIQVKNTTTGKSASVSLPYSSSFSSAEWIEEAPTGIHHVIPLDNFGKVYITNANAIHNGRNVTLQEAHARPIAMNGPSGTILAEASVINTDGAGFTVSRTDGAVSEEPKIETVYPIPHGIPLFVKKHIFRFGY